MPRPTVADLSLPSPWLRASAEELSIDTQPVICRHAVNLILEIHTNMRHTYASGASGLPFSLLEYASQCRSNRCCGHPQIRKAWILKIHPGQRAFCPAKLARFAYADTSTGDPADQAYAMWISVEGQISRTYTPTWLPHGLGAFPLPECSVDLVRPRSIPHKPYTKPPKPA